MSDSILYSEEDVKRTTNLFSNQLIFLRIFGLINPKFQLFLPPKWVTYGKVASKLFNIFVILLILHITILYAITTFNFIQHGGLEDITDALTMLIIFAFVSFAAIYWNARSKALENFIFSLNKFHEHHSLAGITFVSAHRSYESARRMTNYWVFIGCSGAVSWAIGPIILRRRTLPISCWYPFDTKAPVTYEILYCIQFAAQVFMGGIFANGSAIYVSAIKIMLGQFDVLCCSLKNVQAHAELIAGGSFEKLRKIQSDIILNQEEVNQYITCQEHKVNFDIYNVKTDKPSLADLERALKYSMKRCILHHQFILRSCSELERLFSPYCLLRSLQITVQICLLVFMGVMAETSFVRVLNIVQYLMLSFTDLTLFTYYGELLRSHSLRFGEALFRSPWHKNTSLFKKEILIFLINTKKPIQMTAAKFFTMDVTRLRSVLTQAFSFFTLLQKITTKRP